jgi:hypothetical protein
MLDSPGLHRVPEADLVRLLRAVASDQLPAPITRAGLLIGQFASLEGQLDVIIGLGKREAIALLSAVVQERRHRPTPASSLAWAGPAGTGADSRAPSDVLRELIATASLSVFMSGVQLERDQPFLSSLQAAQRGRKLEVCVVLEAGDRVSSLALAQSLYREPQFRAALYVPAPEHVRGVLPYCVLVDHARGLLLAGAAPELEGDDKNVSAGFLIDDAKLVGALERQWQTLIANAALQPLCARDVL